MEDRNVLALARRQIEDADIAVSIWERLELDVRFGYLGKIRRNELHDKYCRRELKNVSDRLEKPPGKLLGVITHGVHADMFQEIRINQPPYRSETCFLVLTVARSIDKLCSRHFRYRI